MNMKQFRYALLLAETGSFSATAEQLGISQPSLSQYVKKIEEQIGADLFERVNGNVRLTDAGRVYIECGKKILDIERTMSSRLLDVSSGKTGTVVVGAAPYRSAGMMPEIAERFKRMYPGICLVTEEMTTSELLEKTEKGEFDVCLMMLPVDEKLFSFEKIMEEELVLAVPASQPVFETVKMPDRKYGAIDIVEINEKNFVTINETQVMQKILDGLCEEYDISVNKAVVVKSLQAQINMVRQGLGWALVPTGIERFCGKNDVRFYSVIQQLPKREIVAMWRRDRQPSEAVRNLIGVMKEINW